jgi:ERCC4-type nuclease
LKHFKSIKRISLATESELQEVVGKSRSSVVYNYFQAKLNL